MPPRRVIVIGASAGGVEALTQLVKGLPGDIDAAVFVTIHFPPTSSSALPRILNRYSAVEASHAVDGEPIETGRIYVAPPDNHLLLFRDQVRLYRGPRENGNRPAIDPMFRSASLAYGARAVGVVLTGSLDDGTSGLMAIKRRHGIAIAQDPEEAMFPSMPQSAIDHVAVDHVSKLERIGPLLYDLAKQFPIEEEEVTSDDAEKDIEYTEIDLARIEDAADHPGVLAPFGCPDCGGTLWELREGDLVRFRCRVGHAWTSEALLARQTETLDAALWTALRALEESASLSKQLSARTRTRGNDRLAETLADSAELATRRAAVIRDVLIERGPPDEKSHEIHPPRAQRRSSNRERTAGGE